MLMKLNIILILAIPITILSACTEQQQSQTQIILQATPWKFQPSNPPHSTLNAQSVEANFNLPTDSTFTIIFTVHLKDFQEEKTILEIPDILSVSLRNHDPNDRKHQNYPAYKMTNGSVPILEANILLQLPVDSSVREMPIGIPLAMLKNLEGEHEIVLHFSGVRWTIYVDGELSDNEFPLGYPVWQNFSSWKIAPGFIAKAGIYFPCINPERIKPSNPKITPEIQYWTPEGHNTWVGDVATFFTDGRYHVFYLFDRRTHGSKFGRGAHYFEHLSTTDFKTWTEHKEATPIEEQWETFGTGTPFMFDGKFCISYGLHTTRIYPYEMTTLPAQWQYYMENGKTGSFRIDSTTGYPAGSTYSVSEDGITNFKKTGIIFHPCENPSVYTDHDGNLKMLANYGAKGTWESKSIDGGWLSVDSIFPPGYDCTFFFRISDFDYIIGGSVGLWSKPANSTDYIDVVKQGLDFYNGMSVPAVSGINDNRFLLAGWIHINGWGGALAIHELVQHPDGVIGTKWMEEIIPKTGKSELLRESVVGQTYVDLDYPSFMLTFDVYPVKDNNNRLCVAFLSEEGEPNSCELQINPDEKLAQYGSFSVNHFAEKEKSLRQGGQPYIARNYAIENLIDVNKPFTVRIIVKASDKFGGSLIDTEIAGKRTMISYRPDLFVNKLFFNTENVKIQNVRIAQLKH